MGQRRSISLDTLQLLRSCEKETAYVSPAARGVVASIGMSERLTRGLRCDDDAVLIRQLTRMIGVQRNIS